MRKATCLTGFSVLGNTDLPDVLKEFYVVEIAVLGVVAEVSYEESARVAVGIGLSWRFWTTAVAEALLLKAAARWTATSRAVVAASRAGVAASAVSAATTVPAT